ncbi:hypothetical protein P280DRAFT_536125 [Massarina eburnea CBS 473.64]|uniref:Rhodopsin domain-containing protein n=1 Tax=Massarina eburnea CBS 473.64 TaxID=1395130 RepID=A0A6A6RN50_9PLEO|nr:hypothetical protein P280DRAFT_536125 [Massarina eburnea CBS 473.64]
MVEGPRYAATVRGGVVMVSLYSWTCIALGVTIARLIIASLHKLHFGRDDATIVAGSTVYLGATVSWQYAVNAGLGKHLDEMRPGDAERYFKAAYSAQLLQISVMALARLSTVCLIDRVAAETRVRKNILLGMVGFWSVYSLFISAFQCGLPRPWKIEAQRCVNGAPLISTIVLGMLVDLVLAVWILPIIMPLRMAKEKILAVAFLFGARIVVPVVAGGQAWAVAKAMRSDDPTFDSVDLALFFQAVTSLSLIVANLPRIKRFLDMSGGNDLNNPRITETEIALSSRIGTVSSSNGEQPLKLVPSNSTKFTTTVESGSVQKEKDKQKIHQEWQKFVSMGSSQDEHTSTSSLFDRQGVMLHQEVTVKVEDRK